MNINCTADPAIDLAAASPAVFRQLGTITRQLHDTLAELGVKPRSQRAVDDLADSRSPLAYLAAKTREAADKVLGSVEQAKAEHASIAATTRALAAAIVANPVRAVASGAVMNFVSVVEGSTARIDRHLTDIMMAQDFHDLTGHVVDKVVSLAADLEESLLKLLVRAAPQEIATDQARALPGEVIATTGRDDTVANQREVDELLASLGF